MEEMIKKSVVMEYLDRIIKREDNKLSIARTKNERLVEEARQRCELAKEIWNAIDNIEIVEAEKKNEQVRGDNRNSQNQEHRGNQNADNRGREQKVGVSQSAPGNRQG